MPLNLKKRECCIKSETQLGKNYIGPLLRRCLNLFSLPFCYRLFEMGFGEQLREILGRLPENRQTVLFSATLPKLLVDFAKAGLTDPTLIRLDVDTKIPDTLKLAFFHARYLLD